MLLQVKFLERTRSDGRGPKPRLFIFKCDSCGNTFERTGKQGGSSLAKHHVHRCGIKCWYDEKNKPPRRDATFMTCAQCGSKTQTTLGRLKTGGNVFCGWGCYQKWRGEHPELMASLQDPDVRKRATTTRSARWASGELKHSRLGKKHTSEAKKKISDNHTSKGHFKGDKNPMKKGHSEKSKRKMSETRTRKMLTGEIKRYGTGHITGIHVSIKTGVSYHFRSSWERNMMAFLDVDSTVVTYSFESVRIPYFLRNKKRWYIPDFIVTYQDGHRSMYELKPKEFINNKKTQAKASAAQMWCNKEGIKEYRILTRDELVSMGVL